MSPEDDAGPVAAHDEAQHQHGSSTASRLSRLAAGTEELAFAIRVEIDDDGGSRTYLVRSLPAAERAVARAASRGREAVVVLCALIPLEVVR